MIDSHTHTAYSHDGKQELTELLGRAEELGVEYLAVTEHLDWDGDFPYIRPLDMDAYYNGFRALKDRFKIPKLAFGCEFGYSPERAAEYLLCPHLKDFDVIINSVHMIGTQDPYYPEYFESKINKQDAFNRYYNLVLQSLSAPYPYQILGHVGYIGRYAPFENKEPEGETLDIVDEIFKKAIALDKTLEVNIHTKKSGLFSVPNVSAIKRYRELGGENITYSSDAHFAARLCEKYTETAEMVKGFGFRHWTVYQNQEPIKIKIE